jgi:tRNA nucleotidyltransferase/poly(A) polymerase
MPEYIYLLENRLTAAQQNVVKQVRDAAREAGMTVFLTGGAVRDLTTGSSVRNFNFSVQGNALDLEAALVARGAEVWGTHEPTRTLTLWFPGSVRADVTSTRSEEYPKPGKPVYHWSTIVEDLRRRDFTANAMALSLNQGSYGLLLDPLNGVADIEARLLRVASNYGFIEDPSRLVRATRLQKRLGWQIEDRTATRYANAKESDAIKALSPYLRGYELEKIASEEDALDTVKALEAEGWMHHLFPAWTSAKADTAGLESLRKNWIQLLMQGVIADLTVAHLELLTAGMDPHERDALKKAMVHPGLVRHWEALDESAKEFAKLLTGKGAAQPSATWKLLTTHPAEPVLWLAHTRKGGAVDAKFKSFFTVWPDFKKKVPAALMLEMRITPELPGYADLLEQLFYQLIDGNLETDEQMRAFLEPWSPPAPPPPPTVRRSRSKKSESKTKRRISAPDEDDEDTRDEDDEDAEDVEEADEDEDEVVEDEALSTVLDKLHGDEIGVDVEDPEDVEDVEDVADVDEGGDSPDGPDSPGGPPGKAADLPVDEVDREEEAAPVRASTRAKAKSPARAATAQSKQHEPGKGTAGKSAVKAEQAAAAKGSPKAPEGRHPLAAKAAADHDPVHEPGQKPLSERPASTPAQSAAGTAPGKPAAAKKTAASAPAAKSPAKKASPPPPAKPSTPAPKPASSTPGKSAKKH